MAIFIGAYLPDRQLDETPFNRALIRVAAGLAGLKQHPLQASLPHIDLHFMMPGKEESPPFEGMRFHSFDSKAQTLRVESAVPSRMLDSAHAEAFVIAVMQDAIDNAEDFFDEQSTIFKRDDYFNLIEQLSSQSPQSLN